MQLTRTFSAEEEAADFCCRAAYFAVAPLRAGGFSASISGHFLVLFYQGSHVESLKSHELRYFRTDSSESWSVNDDPAVLLKQLSPPDFGIWTI